MRKLYEGKKYTLTSIRKKDGKQFVRDFKTKKEMYRYMNNNYIEYKFVNPDDYKDELDEDAEEELRTIKIK